MKKAVLLVHGGALGTKTGEPFKQGLEEALLVGYELLQRGKSSLDAVEAAVQSLENNPSFNAGRGAVISHSGICELDASIMDGKSGKAGAVAGITVAKNPITAARAVMDRSEYVMLAGSGANSFAHDMGLDIVEPDYFITPARWQRYQQTLKTELKTMKLGTVGAVAIDQEGNLAAGTSTGGQLNKRYGRVGDSPIIGAGTYASNESCAVSCTGHGEMFMRLVLAHDVAASMLYKGLSIEQVSEDAIRQKLTQAGGQGGLIALDRSGNFAMPFNTEGMYRGFITEDGQFETHIF